MPIFSNFNLSCGVSFKNQQNPVGIKY